MKVWLVRGVVLILIAWGIITLCVFFCTKVLERGPIADRLVQDGVRELSLAGELLVQLAHHGHESGYSLSADLGDVTASYMLYDESMTPIIGNVDDPFLIDIALQAREKKAFVGTLPGPMREQGVRIDRAMPFTARDGKLYYIAENIVGVPSLPVMDTAFWIGLRIMAVLLAVGVMVILVRITESPVREMRRALRRFAHGEYDARVKLDTGRKGDELAKLAHEFNAMAEHMGMLHAEQQRLFGEISHEMRSPLSRMSLAVELAGRSSSPEIDRLLERIRRDADRLGLLSNEMLDLARHQRNDPQDGLVNLAELIRQVVFESRFEAETVGKQVLWTALPEGMFLMGCQETLYRMLENVIRNGIRYTPAGTAVTVSMDKIDRAGREMAVLQISDQGPGVNTENLQDIFRPFVHGSSSHDLNSKGLGLAITRHVALRHGGNVFAENSMTGGLVVTIRLPLAKIQSVVSFSTGSPAVQPVKGLA